MKRAEAAPPYDEDGVYADCEAEKHTNGPGSLHRAARWVVLPPSSNFFTPFRAPTALLQSVFSLKLSLQLGA